VKMLILIAKNGGRAFSSGALFFILTNQFSY